MNNTQDIDPYIGLTINNDWKLTEKIGSGKLGRFTKPSSTNDILACKIIPENRNRMG